MMSQTQEKHHQAELRQAFRLFDADGDGFITRDDLKRVMRNCGESLTNAELDTMFTKADINKDNLVDLKGKGVFLLKRDHFPITDIAPTTLVQKIAVTRLILLYKDTHAHIS